MYVVKNKDGFYMPFQNKPDKSELPEGSRVFEVDDKTTMKQLLRHYQVGQQKKFVEIT